MKTESLYPKHPILIVDDESQALRSVSLTLKIAGINNIITCSDSRDVPQVLSQNTFDLVILDLNMPFLSGNQILAMIQEHYPDLPTIIITAMDEVDSAVRCIQDGAFDYFVKPVEKDRVINTINRIIGIKKLHDQTRRLKEQILRGELENPQAFSETVTQNKAMIGIFQYLESIASSNLPILVTGETGVGKELVVRAIHAVFSAKSPLVSVNVAGLDDTAFSDTLFGHLQGAYTGATNKRVGLVEKASGGILHLDEIGDLNQQSQVKLLRLLQGGDFFKLGADTPCQANVKIVATTNHEFINNTAPEHFRKDLYYRLAVHHVHIPPLRERKNDIGLLLKHFIYDSADMLGKEPPTYSEDVLAAMHSYDFPGNIREFQTIVHDAVSSNKTRKLTLRDFKKLLSIGTSHKLPAPVYTGTANKHWTGISEDHLPTLEEATEKLIIEALARCNNNQSKAARLLGISRQRLARHLSKLH